MFIVSKYNKQQHPFHMVTPSPWPICTAFALAWFFTSIVVYLHLWRTWGFFSSLIAIILIFALIFFWFEDIITEATFQGHHTQDVYNGLRFGMLLFITSEIMFFFAFFWAFFHSSLIPSIFIGNVWPPIGIQPLNPWTLPFLNTVILLTSGITVTWSHRAILSTYKAQKKWIYAFLPLEATVMLGIIFTLCQAFEYFNAPFSIQSSIYGSVFFLATGFHGFHVIIGTIFLAVCVFRMSKRHFTVNRHLGLEAAIWYWHFVDAVWLFLFITIYWWGS